MSLPIQEETRLSQLREAEPAAAAALDELVPALARIKDPVLRQVVETNLTLAQAAGLGGVPLASLLRQLRQITGQESAPVTLDDVPDWVKEDRVELVIDAAAMLQTGEHPIGKVRQGAAALQPGGILKLLAPFRPTPLIETMARAGYAVYCRETAGCHEVYLGRV